MTRPHAELVERALARADARRSAAARMPDDVLAVEVVRLRRLLELRDEALAKARRDLADAEARRTTGGRHRGYDVPNAWRNADLPAPPSADDPAAPPLGRAAVLRGIENVQIGEEL